MRTIFLSSITLLFFGVLTLGSCKKDKPKIPNETEVITTLAYTLTPANGGTPVVFKFVDADGDGGNAPVITNGVLQANTTYEGVITLLNETKTPPENVHEEVLAEGDEHQFFYENTLNNITVTYKDRDKKGKDLGLKTTFKTGAAERGNLTVILKHKPNKSAAGVAIDKSSPAGGETDIEVKFDVVIQ